MSECALALAMEELVSRSASHTHTDTHTRTAQTGPSIVKHLYWV